MASPYAEGRRIENFYLVRERDRKRGRELLLLVFGLLPVALALLGYTWIHLEVRKSGYRIEVLGAELEDLSRVERQLILEESYLENPELIRALTREKLGMVEPVLEQMIHVVRP